tara:strand:+ start:3068 stop:3475 length:408 start_codon:yes stop_codon:yes gene_type:complete
MTAINFTNALGLHEQALHMRTERSAVLANNLANAETPGFKAQDFDFVTALQQAQKGQRHSRLRVTHEHHVTSTTLNHGSTSILSYRVPLQKSLDGNTVDAQLESAAFARNALEFGASFRFLNGKFASLSKAISGR